MVAIHTLWSKPYFFKNKNPDFYLKDYDILVMVMSALKWREKNGQIILYADDYSRNLIEKFGLSIFYDQVKSLKVDEDIKAQVFWAGGKLFSLKDMDVPVVSLDLDMVVWDDLSDVFEKNQIVAMHTEEILERIYKNKDYFNMKESYMFNKDLDWHVLPVNTALLYIKDMDFKNFFLDKSIEFMKNTLEEFDNLSYMVL